MTQPVRVAVASRSFSRHPVLRAELEARYPGTTFNDSGRSLAGDELVAFLDGHDKAITALERVDDALLDRLPRLKAIGKYGVGLDMIDMAALARRGIRLGWRGGVNRRSVSEWVVSCAIALLRHIPAANREVRSGTFRQVMGRQITGKTWGIIGCGHIGKDLSGLLAAFDARILVHDILDMDAFCRPRGIDQVGLADLLSRSDIVTLHVPLDASTRGLLSAERLALMRPDAILLNGARGGLVDEQALKRCLAEGRLAAAAFDVFDPEPPTDMDLLGLPNFLATPHIGGSAEEAVVAMGRAAIDGLDDNQVPEPGVWPA